MAKDHLTMTVLKSGDLRGIDEKGAGVHRPVSFLKIHQMMVGSTWPEEVSADFDTACTIFMNEERTRYHSGKFSAADYNHFDNGVNTIMSQTEQVEEESPDEEENEKPKLKKKHWSSLSHSGVSFPERYRSDPRTNRITIKGEPLTMTPAQEEMAVAWSKRSGHHTSKYPIFQTNFLSDFVKLFPEKFKEAKISDIIFPTLPEKVESTKEQKKALAAERKKRRLELKEKFGYATVDGVKTEIANWVVEPPGLFMGRGQHPMRGRWKLGIQEEDITLNLDKTTVIPPGKWKIINAPDCMWIACWTDKLVGESQVRLAPRFLQH